MTPTVISEMATMQRVAETGCGLSRSGRCELKLAYGRSGLAQAPDPKLARELRYIWRCANEHTLVCLPPMFGGFPDESKEHYYGEFARPEVVAELFDSKKVYGSTGVSRRDWWRSDMDEDAYWATVRGIWQDRPVLLIAGSEKGRRAADAFLSNASSVDTLDAPERDAWAARKAIRSDILAWARTKRNPVVYMALGATAAVLSHQLGAYGIQALDLGHMCQSWHRADMKGPELKKAAA